MAVDRAKKLAQMGVAAYERHALESLEPQGLGVIHAIAAMLAEATKDKKQREKKPITQKADFKRGMERLQLLSSEAPEAVLWTAAPATIAALGSRRCDEEDLHDLARYLKSGGLSWMREKPALSFVVRKFDELVARSKEHVRPQLPQESALDRARRK